MTAAASTRIVLTPGIKAMYLIRRKPDASREELVAHWFANHMPQVITMREQLEAAGQMFPRRYLATLFEPDARGERPWDGVAQLWWDEALPRPDVPHGADPADTFQEKAEPYVPWYTREHVALDTAPDRLTAAPNRFNAPYPMTRSGFYKVCILVKAREGVDHDAMFDHWLNVHALEVNQVLAEVGGFRYLLNLSTEPQVEPYAGMAELYFDKPEGWQRFMESSKPDGFEDFMDPKGTVVQGAYTEMVGIPGE